MKLKRYVLLEDDATDLIRLLDLILINTGRIIRIRSEEQVRYWKAHSYRIAAIYKKIGKDYICVWEKGITNVKN